MHIKLFSILASLFFCFSVLAEPAAERVSLNGDNVRIEGVRFQNAEGGFNNGPWVLLTHGLHSNFHEFQHLVPILMAAGYDCYAFNFRGHGNGNERSHVLEYFEGGYELEHMAQTDLALMLEHIRNFNRHRGHIIGHSMGGMVPRAAIAMNSLDQSRLASMVLLGSPPHFRSQSLMQKLLGPILESEVFRGAGNENMSLGRFGRALETIVDVMNLFNPVHYWIKGAVEDVMGHEWQRKAMTEFVPKDILRSFAKFTKQYPYEDVRLQVPALYIMGDRDVLVKDSDIVETAKVQSGTAGYWFMKLKGVGHLSLVASPVAVEYGRQLLQFLSHPEAIGPKNQTAIEFRPVSGCQAYLVVP